jgi:hypothetical protein
MEAHVGKNVSVDARGSFKGVSGGFFPNADLRNCQCFHFDHELFEHTCGSVGRGDDLLRLSPAVALVDCQ